MISHKNKFIFIHIPKTAGESILRTLYNIETGKPFAMANHKIDLHGIINDKYEERAIVLMGKELRMQHSSAIEYRKIFTECFDEYFKFAFVRNPWDMLVSTYKWGHKNFPNLRTITFEAFLNDILTFTNTMNFVKHRAHTCCQLDYIYDNGNCIVDFIGRFENLQNDFNIVCDKIGFEKRQLIHENKSPRSSNYKEYYTPKLKDLVAEKFKRDIEIFNYEF